MASENIHKILNKRIILIIIVHSTMLAMKTWKEGHSWKKTRYGYGN